MEGNAGAAVGGGAGSGAAPGSSGGAAPSGPSPGAVNLGAGAEHDAGGGAQEGADPAKPAAPKYKTKRGGKEVEYDGSELARMLSDDFEHEFRGPGGKPIKARWSDIERRVQQAEGWEAKMRKATELEQRITAEREWGKQKPEHIEAYLEKHLGVEDVDSFILQRARERAKRDKVLTQLNSPLIQGQDGKWYNNPDYNPSEYNRRVGEIQREKFERRQKAEQAAREAEQKQVQQREQTQRREAAVTAALKDGKVSLNKTTRALADEVIAYHQQMNIKLDAETLAREVKQRYRDLTISELSAMDDDGLAEFFGGDFRERMRKIELAAAKGKRKAEEEAKKQESAANGGGTFQAGGAQTNGKGVTEAQFRRQYRMGRQ